MNSASCGPAAASARTAKSSACRRGCYSQGPMTNSRSHKTQTVASLAAGIAAGSESSAAKARAASVRGLTLRAESQTTTAAGCPRSSCYDGGRQISFELRKVS